MNAAEIGYVTGALAIAGLPAYVLIRLCVARQAQGARWALAGSAIAWVWAVFLLAPSTAGIVAALVGSAAAIHYAPLRT